MNLELILIFSSLGAAFLAGLVALFAPCCIGFLLPAYFGSVFKVKKKVLAATLLFTAGISLIILPIALGLKVIVDLFFQFHDEVYLFGGGLMIFFGLATFLNWKLHFSLPLRVRSLGSEFDILTIFLLGMVSGLATVCCAPVLLGAMTMAALSPTLFVSLAVGLSYVAGMVAPLYLISLVLDYREWNWLKAIRSSTVSLSLFGKKREIPLTNLLASLIFLGMGILVISLYFTVGFAMPGMSH